MNVWFLQLASQLIPLEYNAKINHVNQRIVSIIIMLEWNFGEIIKIISMLTPFTNLIYFPRIYLIYSLLFSFSHIEIPSSIEDT